MIIIERRNNAALSLAGIYGGWIELVNGWRLALPHLGPDTRLPVTVDARRLAG